ALFLLHGLSSNARVWERVARRLPWRRVVALDMRSHGLSDRPLDGHHAPVDLVEDAAQAIRELALDRPLVAGHSWGAAIALQPEALFPHVRGPLLLAMAGQSWEGAPQNVIQWRRQSVEAVPALRPDAQVRWYESRHDIPLIRPAELAADLDRTAIAAAFGSVASWAAH